MKSFAPEPDRFAGPSFLEVFVNPLDETGANPPAPGRGDAPLSAIDKYLIAGMQNQATTIYLFPGAGITYRVGHKLLSVPNSNLTAAQSASIALDILPPSLVQGHDEEIKRQYLDKVKSVDFSYSIHGVARFRVHLFRQRGSLAMCIRIIPHEIPQLSRYALPDEFHQSLKQMRGGLYLINGKARSGKSSFAAAMVDAINKNQHKIVVILEPTIQFSHRNFHSLITQRESGTDMVSLAQGIRDALQQDQDIILVDELAEAEVFDRALDAVLKGITVIGVIGTPDAEKTIQYLLSFKPPSRQLELIGDLMTHFRALHTTELVTDASGKREVRVQYIPSNLLNGILLSRRTDLEQKGSGHAMFEEINSTSSVDQSWFEGD